ncbi:MAG: RNA-binding transcriptional accessory protein [Chloroflexi bacterium]|nr:RNA-binding transcriptional accessory protein [Chloroflexota bacterium]
MPTTVAEQVARELRLQPGQVQRAVELLDDDNTIPFIARYRKEVTGGLDEVQLGAVQERVAYLRHLGQGKADVLRVVEEQGKLTGELREKVNGAQTLQEVEDLYLPFRPKRRTRASVARERGLEPLADLILAQRVLRETRESVAGRFVNPELQVGSVKDALAGARDIVGESLAEDAEIRKGLRQRLTRDAVLRSAVADAGKDTGKKYEIYYEFAEPVATIPPHRILAIDRGEKDDVLRVHVELPFDQARPVFQRQRPVDPRSTFAEDLAFCHEDSYKRLILPSLERELRNALTERAQRHAIAVFSANLRNLLLQPPLRDRTVMGIDPGYVTGCKVAVVDGIGRYVAGATIYPHKPQGRWNEAREALIAMVERHGVDVVAIGNGTASRETEALVVEVIAEVGGRLAYALVSEAGASVYSASVVARLEFPDLDATQRGNISIARRLQDPLAELVKIDPKSIGVGLYQHDVDQKELGKALDAVVTSCVNYVGVDLNTASASLLQYVSGINRRVAASIVKYRDERGKFKNRRQLRDVSGLGEKAFEQSAGFLKIADGDNPLDNTFIHPESYPACERLIARVRRASQRRELPAAVAELRAKLGAGDRALESLAGELGVGAPTLRDMLDGLEKPGRDPRDDLPPPILRRDILKMEDLRVGMVLKGTVRNVVDFGAFVDIGVKQDGLVHVSQLKAGYVANPLDVVAVGDVVTVRVVGVDLERGRIALSMKEVSP